MTKRGRPTQKEALARAWQTIRTAGGEGASEFDAKAVLIAIAGDPNIAPTARLGAVRQLREQKSTGTSRPLIDRVIWTSAATDGPSSGIEE